MVFKVLREKTEKIFWITLSLNVVALAILVFFIYQINGEKDKYLAAAQDLNTKTAHEIGLKILDNSLKDNSDYIQKINSYFVQDSRDDVASFMDEIDNLANSSGVELQVKSILIRSGDEKAPVKPYEEMAVSFDSKGDWSNLIHFLRMLETLPYKVTFEKVSFDKQDEKTITGQSTNKWILSCNISILKLVSK